MLQTGSSYGADLHGLKIMYYSANRFIIQPNLDKLSLTTFTIVGRSSLVVRPSSFLLPSRQYNRILKLFRLALQVKDFCINNVHAYR